jgi:imidazolonepropionase-like amidohydrolase
VTLFDGRKVRTRAGILTSDGAVEWVGAHARAPRAARAALEVDGTGKTLTPGLIDCHVHLCWDGSPDFAAESREMTEARAALKAARNARRNLERGVTTVRDLGAMSHAVIDLARAIEEGMVAGPRVVAAGRPLTITGGHGHSIFAREVDGADALRKAVREEIRAGALVIKLIATGGVLTPGIGADFTAFTPEELDAAVDEARKWGRPVAAHAIGAGGIAGSVLAGVDSIEHGSQIAVEVSRMMKANGTFHVPTISAVRGILEHADEVPGYAAEKASAIAGQARDSFRRTVRAGVRIALGTDAGTPFNPHGNGPLEVVRMVEWGLTPLRALRAATADAADLLRMGAVGRVEPGRFADLVLYDADPLDAIEAVLKPALVMKAGEQVV